MIARRRRMADFAGAATVDVEAACDAPMLRALLERRLAAWREYGWECLAVIAGRGFRKERAA